MRRIIITALCIAVLPMLSMAQNYPERRREDDRGGGRSEMTGEAGSALTVFSVSNERFSLMLNGVKQNEFPQSRIRIEGLPNVVNDIQIIFDDNVTRAISKRVYFVDPVDGKAINLTLKIVRERDGDVKLRFHKSTPLEPDYRAEQGEYIMRYGADNGIRGVRERGMEHKRNDAPPPPPAAPAGPVAMDPQTFESARQAIAGNSFDDGKMSTAKTIAGANYLTTDQVITICQLFQWDESKLDFAKFAFKRTVDNNSYFKVNAVFQWDDSKQKLNDYVTQNR